MEQRCYQSCSCGTWKTKCGGWTCQGDSELFFYIAIIAIPSKGGGAELVQHHVDLCNKQLNTWMEEEVKRQKEVEGRVKIGKFVREAVVRT